MMAQVQSQNIRFGLPEPRRNRGLSDTVEEDDPALAAGDNIKTRELMRNISKIDEDDHANESDTPLPNKHKISPSPFNNRDCKLREKRKRNLSNVDLENINTYKLNTSA